MFGRFIISHDFIIRGKPRAVKQNAKKKLRKTKASAGHGG
jgi:hypothetical protein